jgi:RimJ/RimL family protein N-acetyltransferase
MPATIHKATKDDAKQISEIIAEVTGDPNPVAFSEPLSAEQVAAWIDRLGEEGALFVVDDGRRVLAFAAIDIDSSRPGECSFGAWVRARNRRQGHGTALAEEALAFARERGYQRIRARLPEDNEAALSFLSSIGALVPLTNPGAAFELPIYQENE